MRLPDTLAILRRREFRLWFVGQAVSLFGDGMVRVALPFAVLAAGGSTAAVGLVFAAQMLPLVACLLIGGVLADRTSRRAVMVGADVVRLASQGALAALLITGEAGIGVMAALAAVTGAATGFFNPASTGLLPALVPAEDLQPANGLRATAMAGGEILGPVVAGVLVVSVGAGWAIAVDAATYAASAAVLVRLRLPARVPAAGSTFLSDLHDGWRTFRARRWLWSFVGVTALVNTMWGAWSALGPVIADRSLGGAAAWGTVLGAMGAGGVLGGLVSIRVRPRRPLVLAAGLNFVFATPLALLAVTAPVPLLAVGTFAFGGGLMLANSVWESTLQRNIPSEALSRVSAYDWFGSVAFYPVGLAAWGPIAVAIGTSAALWLAFALMVAATIGLLSVPDVRSMRGATD